MEDLVFPWELITDKHRRILQMLQAENPETAFWKTAPRSDDLKRQVTAILGSLGAINPKINRPFRSAFILGDSKLRMDVLTSLLPVVFGLTTEGKTVKAVTGIQIQTAFDTEESYDSYVHSALMLWDGIDTIFQLKFSKLANLGSDIYCLLKDRSNIQAAYNIFIFGGSVDIDSVKAKLTEVLSFSLASTLIDQSKIFRLKAPKDALVLEDI